MEMGNIMAENDAADESSNDLMQIARVGDVPAMEKLFETSGLDATYTDEEGITPLHVSSFCLIVLP